MCRSVCVHCAHVCRDVCLCMCMSIRMHMYACRALAVHMYGSVPACLCELYLKASVQAAQYVLVIRRKRRGEQDCTLYNPAIPRYHKNEHQNFASMSHGPRSLSSDSEDLDGFCNVAKVRHHFCKVCHELGPCGPGLLH